MHANIQTVRAVLYHVLIPGQRDFEKFNKSDTNDTMNKGYNTTDAGIRMSPRFSAEHSIPLLGTNSIINCTPLNCLPFSSLGDFESAAATEL
jgi:hypothetical protein